MFTPAYKLVLLVSFLITTLSLGFTLWYIQSPERSRITSYIRACDASHEAEKQDCFERTIEKAMQKEEFSKALEVFIAIASSGDIECHGLAHKVGKKVYEYYGQNPKDVFTSNSQPALSYCGWGFWHGFMSAYAMDPVHFESLGTICLSLPAELAGAEDCFHGIGIGAVGDPPPQEVWGKPQEMVQPAISLCFQITDDQEFREQCVQGAFHQIFDFMSVRTFGLTVFPKNDTFSFCFAQKPANQHACFTQLAPRVYVIQGFLTLSSDKNAQRLRMLPYYNNLIAAIASGAANSSDSDKKLTELFNECNEATSLSNSCVEGIISGSQAKGDPSGKSSNLKIWCQTLKDLETQEFCKSKIL